MMAPNRTLHLLCAYYQEQPRYLLRAESVTYSSLLLLNIPDELDDVDVMPQCRG